MTPIRISGTKEWSVASINIILGCPHRCRYCYARARAVRLGQCPSSEAWGTSYHRLRPAEVTKRRQKVAGRIMFPSTHDITPDFLQPCLDTLDRLLAAGNDVLIVSKPHWPCVKSICDRFSALYREAILFRFTIGAASDAILNYWEPGAPAFPERLASLRHAFERGFATSVSCEPLLDAAHVDNLVSLLLPYVTDTIWIGKANDLRRRVAPDTDETEIRRIEAGQTLESIQRIYALLKDLPQIRWKESYKAALGLPEATSAGLDL